MISKTAVLLLSTGLFAGAANAASTRLVIDDDQYADQVSTNAVKFLQAGKLVSTDVLRAQIHHKSFAIPLPPVSENKLEATEVYQRLLNSTLTVGDLYKCPECGEWHFNGSAGFVIAEGGIVSTCCHVVAAEDKEVTESYLVAADAAGRVYPVRGIVAADPEADTCILKLDAPGLKPLALRPAARVGERVFCLSHPGGYYFMFTEGMVARVNLKQNEMLDERGKTNGILGRPILFLNVTAEFAPGSSGAPIVDECGNVLAQVASIADAGEPPEGADENAPASPSVPVRFCTASEELLKLTHQPLAHYPKPEPRQSKADNHKQKRY